MRVLSLESYEYVTNGKVRGGGSRSSISSDKRSTDQTYPIVQSDLPGNFTDRDVNYDRTGRMQDKKYLRKIYY